MSAEPSRGRGIAAAGRRLRAVQPAIVPEVEELIDAHPGTISLGQGMVSAQPRGLAVLDVDVATANRSVHELSILRNDGSGVFGNVTTFGTGTAGEWALAAGDMDDDGILDLVAGGNANGRIYVYLGNGDGTFTLSDDVAAGGSPWMLIVGDLNGDGAADVSTANNTTGTIVLGDGAGNLGTPQTYGIDDFGLATDFGDLDSDGDLDWITASFNGDWRLFLNDGAGNFTFDRESRRRRRRPAR